MKTMSIIGIILFSLLFIDLMSISTAEFASNLEDLETLGTFSSTFDLGEELTDFTDSIYELYIVSIISTIFGFLLSCFGLVASRKKRAAQKDLTAELLDLGLLKERGILSEDEFEARKRKIMISK